MKFCGVATFISLSVLATLCCTGNATNSTWGYIGPYDIVLQRQNVIKKSSWMSVVSADVIYPPKNHVSQYIISGIRAIDHDRVNGGYGTLIKGGPGFRNATINLKSQRSGGLNFTVEFFGRR
ncbi:probable salivary secreted peptide [Teleopsis dalmanni]|uniref:probable salivary secreted peptide n=1 Tax=Teleopsis dalmanni TaxID=139649 RepID=UPI0018CD221C|nr:probable salivary secreted peptide [Teleopsis dalmanni]